MKNTFEKKLLLRLFILLTTYAILGFFVILLSDYIVGKFSTSLSQWIVSRKDIIYILYLIIGFCIIFYHYWKKPWKYLNEVTNATQTIYQMNDSVIKLSEPLNDIENQMNQIKMSILLNQKVANDAENKKNELLMYLAHDIRTPLTSVIGYLSLLKETPELPPEQQAKYTKVALSKAQHLEKLIKEFFEITRYNSSNSIVLEKESIDLYYMLIQIADEFYPTAISKGNRINLNCDENITVSADGEKLARAFNNILKNAISYSYNNTEINIEGEVKNDELIIVFKNFGKTLKEDELRKIFDKFNRLDEARNSDTGGAGLGLSIAQEIIHLHGGKIHAESENETISFIVTLPISS